MILILKEEKTDTGKRVEAERGMIMIRIEAGIGTETEEDGPNKNISGVSTQISVTLLICILFCKSLEDSWLFVMLGGYTGNVISTCKKIGMKRLPGNCYCRQSFEVPNGNWLLIPPYF